MGATRHKILEAAEKLLLLKGSAHVTTKEIAREVAATLERRGVGNLADREGSYRFLCTGDERAFQDVAGRFLQLPLTEVERVDPARLEIAA